MFPVILRVNNGYFSRQKVIIGVYNVDCVLCEVGKPFWCIIEAVPLLGCFVTALSLLETPVQSQGTPCGICGGEIGIRI